MKTILPMKTCNNMSIFIVFTNILFAQEVINDSLLRDESYQFLTPTFSDILFSFSKSRVNSKFRDADSDGSNRIVPADSFFETGNSLIPSSYEYKNKNYVPLKMEDGRMVLPEKVVPVSYDLVVSTFPDKNVFKGNVSILVEVKEDSPSIFVNYQTLSIESHEIYKVRFEEIDNNVKNEISSFDLLKIENKIENYVLNKDVDKQTLKFDCNQGVFAKGFYLVNISFSSDLSRSMNGYYISKYLSNGVEKFMYSTHFEATAARSCFPCFDQPDMKAVFRIHLIVPNGMLAVSNSSIEKEITIKELKSELKSESGEKHFNAELNPSNIVKGDLNKENEAIKNFSGANDSISSYSKIFNSHLIGLLKDAPDDYKYVSFGLTPIMSTYLVAFAIGDLGYIERESDFSPKIKLRVYAPLGEEVFGKFSLDVAHDCIKIFQDYFSIDYPLEKMDMIAIPEFAMGAMENWGMITYRSSALLFDPLNSTMGTKKSIAETVCHELAHQWFGNLVTMKWWDDLWLNEGFATWAAALGVSKLRTDLIDYDIWSSFIASDMEYGMGTDALISSHPIQVTVNDPEEIDQIFDGISYSKGASLIRMVEDYVGSEMFRKGLHNYLKNHSYGNATTDDLWKEIGEVAGKDIKSMMGLWVTKVGFPVIRVTEKDDVIHLSQERFLLSHKPNNTKEDDLYNTNENNVKRYKASVSTSTTTSSSSKNDNQGKKFSDSVSLNASSSPKNDNQGDKVITSVNKNTSSSSNNDNDNQGNESSFSSDSFSSSSFENKKDNKVNDVTEIEMNPWFVPLKVSFYENDAGLKKETIPDLFELNTINNTFKITKKSNLYKFNHEGTGFYRVLYSENENMILKLLRSNKLSSRDRLNLMNDYFQLSIGNYIKCTMPLILSQEFKKEDNSDVLYSVLGGLGEIKSIFYDDDKNRKIIENLILNLVRDRSKDVDIVKAGKDMNEITLNTYIIDSAVSNNDPLTLEILTRIFEEHYEKDKSTVHPVFRRSMFVSVIKKNHPGIFDKVWNIYLKTQADDQKNMILSSLGATNDDENFKKLIGEILGNTVKLQDKIYIFSALAGNLKRRDQLINWTIENWDEITKMYKGSVSLIGYVVERVFSTASSETMYKKVTEFLKSLKDAKAYKRSVDKSLERSEIRNRFRKGNTELLI